MKTVDESALGKGTVYSDQYDPGLLFSIERAPQHAELGIGDVLPFHGVDIWNAYELSWLDARGKPHVAMAELRVPANSPRLIESKSLKLYLNGFAGERTTPAQLIERIAADLSRATGARVEVRLIAAVELAAPPGRCIDGLDIGIDHYGPPRPDFLHADNDADIVHETLVSHLLKSNCPVTGQPDWGSVLVTYRGRPIDRAGLLRYVVSYRNHNAFHEQCVERMFVDIARQCAPTELTVYARYTRRGGLDINPLRSSRPDFAATNMRLARQ